MKEKPNPEAGLSNDVQVIRDILLGEHLERFQKRVDTLEAEVSALKKENKALRQDLKVESEKTFQKLTEQLSQERIDRERVNESLRKDYEAQIKELKKRLSAYEEKQGGLIASLANALLEYRDKSGK